MLGINHDGPRRKAPIPKCLTLCLGGSGSTTDCKPVGRGLASGHCSERQADQPGGCLMADWPPAILKVTVTYPSTLAAVTTISLVQHMIRAPPLGAHATAKVNWV